MNRYVSLLLMFLSTFCLSACHTSKSYTFRIENGEMIEVELDTSDGYDLTQENGRFAVEKSDETILQGYFLTEDGLREKETLILSSKDVEIKRKSEHPKLYVYQYDGEAGLETDFLLQVEKAKTGVIIGSLHSFEEAEAAFENMSFLKEE
ncbi:MAG: hypothetical protein HFF02_02635 [Erysipelotrichaceae bacterium]|nr:hypothetical protein [Erysipelotrichaceae bacterium]